MTEAAKLHAARLGGMESGFRPYGNHLALRLSHDGHDPDDHLVRFGHVGGDKSHAGLLQAKQEMGVARQAVDFGDDQRRIAQPTERHRLRQLGAVVVLAAFDLDELLNELPMTAVQIILEGFALRLEAKVTTLKFPRTVVTIM